MKDYEREIITDEGYGNELEYRLEEGWEIEKTEIIKKEEKSLFHKKDKVVKVYHIRRDITPTKIILNLNLLTVPKWKIKMKQVDSWDFSSEIDEQLIKLGLKERSENE